MNLPADKVLERTVNHEAVLPTTEVVQLAEPFVNGSDEVFTPAMAPMSGAATLEASASASAVVKVETLPNPPRTPVVEVELPGDTISRLLPRALICAPTCCWVPNPSPTVRITALIPINMPSIVRPDLSRWHRMEFQLVRSVSRKFTGRTQYGVRPRFSDSVGHQAARNPSAPFRRAHARCGATAARRPVHA